MRALMTYHVLSTAALMQKLMTYFLPSTTDAVLMTYFFLSTADAVLMTYFLLSSADGGMVTCHAL